MKKKTLLIRLNYEGFPVPPPDLPLGILYLAAALEANGFPVVVRDLSRQMIEDEIFEQIRTGEIGMVGITMLSYVRSEGYALIRKIKQINPNSFIVLGGIFALSFPDELIRRFPVDACAVGEGEEIIVELAKYRHTGEGFEDIKGIYSKLAGWHGAREPIKNIDDISFPAWNHSDFDWFKMTCATLIPDKVVNGVRLGDARWAPIIASRGCVGRCVFCNAFKHWGNKVRYRSAESILDEIEVLYHEYDIRLLAFNDDAFPMNHQQCLDFCSGLHARDLKIAWQTTTRADGIDDEVCRAMAAAGCFMVAVGIESGSSVIHRKLQKGINLDKAVESLQSIRRAGMISYALLMIGNPGESDETISETIAFLKKSKPNYYSHVSGVMIVPGTKLCEMAVSGGQIDNSFWFDENSNGLPHYTVENSEAQFALWAERIGREVPKCL